MEPSARTGWKSNFSALYAVATSRLMSLKMLFGPTGGRPTESTAAWFVTAVGDFNPVTMAITELLKDAVEVNCRLREVLGELVIRKVD